MGCFQIRLRRITTATIKSRMCFCFPAFGRKSKPLALQVVVDSQDPKTEKPCMDRSNAGLLQLIKP
jgi:hypothetical protein